MNQISLTPPQPSRNLQATSTLLISTTRTLPFFHSHSTLDNMPRAQNTSDSPRHPVAYRNWYFDWCKERKLQGLSCSRKFASSAWRKMSEDEKARYRAQPHETPESPHITGPFHYLDEDEDLINNVVSLNPSPVKEEEQLPLSPLFSEFEHGGGPSIFDEFYAPGPSVLDQGPSTEPRRVVLELPFSGPSSANEFPLAGPSFNTDQFSFAAPSPSVDEPFVDSPPAVSHSTPIPSHPPLPANDVVNEPDFSLLDEAAYTYQASLPPAHELTFPEYNFWDETSYDPIPTEIHQLDLPTPVPTTPMTGYNALQTPWYTPGLHSQPLPTGLDDTQFLFDNVEVPVVPEQQQTWSNNYESSECFPQLSMEPPTPAPPLAPVPEIGGQFDQMAGFQGDPYQWNGAPNAQMFENNQFQIPPAPVFDQNLPLAAVQQVFNAVNINNLGQEGKRLGLVGVQLWFTPT